MSAAPALRPAWGVRSYLAFLVLAVALPAGGLIAYGIDDTEREATTRANVQVQAITENIAGQIALIVRENEALLGRIAARPLVRALDPKRCDPAIRELVDLNPQYVTLAIRDSLGNPVCTYHSDPYGAERMAELPWFRDSLRSGGFSISGAFFRAHPGRWVSTFTTPVRDASGRVAGLVLLPLDLLLLQQQIMHSLPQHAIAGVLDREGFFLMRSLEAEKWIGKQGRLPQFPESFWREHQGFVRVSGMDGVARLYAFTTVPGAGWRVFAGLPEDIVFAAHRERVKLSFAIGLLIVLLAAGAAWGVSRAIAAPIRDLAGAARAVTGGDLAARAPETGAAEVARVAREFNRMLDAREQFEAALRDSEAKYRQFVEHSPDPTFAHSDGHLVLANAAMEGLLGAAPGQLLGTTVLDIIAPADREIVKGRIAKVVHDLPVPRVEVGFVRLDGSVVPVEAAASPIRHLGEPAVLVTARDITDRKRAEEALRESEEKLRLFVDHAPSAIAMFDRDMRYLAYSRRWLRDYGLGDRDLSGLSHYEVFPDLPERWKEIHRKCLAGAIEKAEEDPFPRADGSVDWVRWEVHPWHARDGAIGGIIIFSEVVSERKQAQDALRELSRRLLEVEEAARRAISRELHDRIGQDLSAVALGLDLVRGQIPAGKRAAVGPKIEDLRKQLAATVRQVRDVMAELRPPALDDYGLMVALKAYSERYSARTGVPVRVEADTAFPRLPAVTETALFRIAQEALANVAKHARAKQAGIALATQAGRASLSVTDDGPGFDAGRAPLPRRPGASRSCASARRRSAPRCASSPRAARARASRSRWEHQIPPTPLFQRGVRAKRAGGFK